MSSNRTTAESNSGFGRCWGSNGFNHPAVTVSRIELAEQIKKGQFKTRKFGNGNLICRNCGVRRLPLDFLCGSSLWQSPAHLITKASLHESPSVHVQAAECILNQALKGIEIEDFRRGWQRWNKPRKRPHRTGGREQACPGTAPAYVDQFLTAAAFCHLSFYIDSTPMHSTLSIYTKIRSVTRALRIFTREASCSGSKVAADPYIPRIPCR